MRIFEDSSSITFTAKEVAVALSDLDYLLSVMENADLAAGVDLPPDLDTTQVKSRPKIVYFDRQNWSEIQKDLIMRSTMKGQVNVF